MSLYRKFAREVALSGLAAPTDPADAIQEAQLAPLPEPAQRYLRFMGVVGRQQDWSFRVGWSGRFRIKPGQRWMRCEAWQYNLRPSLARIFHIRIRAGGVLPILARDTYVGGRGRMLVRLMDRFTIADGTGEEYDIGELVTYLNDAVSIAPTMLLDPRVTWSPADGDSFDVSLSDHGRTVTARVLVDKNGALRDFITTDRFCSNPQQPGKLMRARWRVPVTGWQTIDGRTLPAGGQAVWELPSGPFPYADFLPIPGSLIFNLPPDKL